MVVKVKLKTLRMRFFLFMAT